MAYSKDLRKRAVEYFIEHSPRYEDVAKIFKVAVGSIHHWVKEYDNNKKLEPGKPSGRPPKITQDKHEVLRNFVLKNADKSLTILAEKWHEEHGQKLSISALGRTIAKAGLTLKKKTFRATERDSEAYQLRRNAYFSELQEIPEENRVYLDEAGSNLAMTPFKAWSLKKSASF